MKTNILQMTLYAFCCVTLMNNQLKAQVPNWDWAKTAGGVLSDVAYSVTTDANGNVIVAGSFSSTSITFGSNILTNTNAATRDVFLVKYDASGSVIWAKSNGSSDEDVSKSVTTDASGNIYVAGYFTGTAITFGTYTLVNTSATFRDVFLVKYDVSGNVLWARSAGGKYHDEATFLSTDPTGNILMTGFFLADSIIFGTDTLLNTGSNDMFVVKYNTSGNVLWANSEGGNVDEKGESIASDADGNVLVAGSFTSQTITIGSTTLIYAGGAYSDIFLVKYDSSGAVVWVKGAGGDYLDEPDCVTADANGNIYMSGIVYSTYIVFGADTLFNSGYTFYGDMFLVKYDAAGNVLWSEGSGNGNNNDWCSSVEPDGSGNIIITGAYGSTINLDTIALSNGPGIFVAKYNGSGNALWAVEVKNGIGNSIATDNYGNMYVAGYHYGDSITFGNTTLVNAGSNDMFVARLTDSLLVGINTDELTISPVYVFPNPTTGKFTVVNKSGEITVCDLFGRLLLRSKEVLIDMSSYPAGFYIWRVGNATGTLVIK